MKPILSVALFLCFTVSLRARDWQAGFGSVVITPEKPIPLVGYAARTNAFKQVDQDIYAKALALKDAEGNRAVLVITKPSCVRASSTTALHARQVSSGIFAASISAD